MKKKYLKKILAVMLASMTVSATPGLVGAMSKEAREAIQEANSKIENHKFTIAQATDFLNNLEAFVEEDDEAKAEVSWTLGEMIHEGLFGKTSHYNDHIPNFDAHMCSPENLSRIIKIFKKCSTSDVAKRNTAWAIRIMAREGLLGRARYKNSFLLIPQCSPEDFEDIIYILDQCLKYKDSSVKEADYAKVKEHVAGSVFEMARRGVLGESNFRMRVIGEEPFRKCLPDQTSKIMGFLEECLNGNEETVADDIAYLASRELLGQYPNDKILNMLQDCFKKPDAKESVAQALRVCAAQNLFDQNSLQSILGMLEQCLQSYEAKGSIAPTISFMAKNGMIKKDSLNRILNMLHSCCNHFDAGFFISRAIINMVETGLINEQNIDELLLQILQKCSQDRYSRDYVSEAIKVIAQRGLLNQCPYDKLKRIIGSLLSCREYNDFSKRYVSEAIQAMAEQNVLYRCEPNQIQEIAGALVYCLQGEGFIRETINAITVMNNKELLNQCNSADIHRLVDALIERFRHAWPVNDAASAILAMNDKGLLNRCTPDQIRQITGKLTEFLGNNDTQEASITTLSAIVRNNNMLSQLTPAELGQLANSLPGMLANNNTRDAATIIISAMAENPATFNQFNNDQLQQILHLFRMQLDNYLASGNYEMVDRIFVVLKKCSEIDALKADVADIAEMLVSRGNFYLYLNENNITPRLGTFFRILISCSQTQNVETQKKALEIIEFMLFRTGPTKTIRLTNEAAYQISQNIPQIIQMLENSSNTDENKKYVAPIIDLLGKWGFFQGLTGQQQSSLITSLDNCLVYGGIPNDYDIERIVTTVCAMFMTNRWMPAFRNELSPNDQMRLEAVRNNAIQAGDDLFGPDQNNVQNNMQNNLQDNM